MKRMLVANLLVPVLCLLMNGAMAQLKRTDSVTTAQAFPAFEKSVLAPDHHDLFFGSTDIARIRLLIKKNDPVITMGFRGLQTAADRYLQYPPVRYALDDAGLRIQVIHDLADQVPVLVLMYRITNEKKYAEKCLAQMAEMVKFPDWGEGRHFLDAGIAAFNAAFVYSGLYNEMPSGFRASLVEATKRHVLLPAAQQVQHKAWWYLSPQNWNGVCNSGIVMAALAMRREDEALMRTLFTTAVNGLPAYLNAFEPDGQSEEGVWYWNYGQLYTILGIEAMQRTLGTSFGLYDRPGLKKTGWFPFYMSGPAASLNIGDDAVKEGLFPSYFWYARQFNDSQLARKQYEVCMQNKTVSWLDLLYYQPELLAENTQTGIAGPSYLRGIELVSLRQNEDKNSLFIAMHGGNNAANHGHLDAGSFEIQALGEVWAYANLGKDKYVYPGYFTMDARPTYLQPDSAQQKPGRFHFYRVRAEGKNCVVFNPATGPDQDPVGIAKIGDVIRGGNVDSCSAELTDCYKRDIHQYRRSISLHKKKPAIYVTDEMNTIKPSALWWSMHTKARIKLSADKRVAFLTIKDKTMVASINAPATAVFQVLEATYLPGESFPLTHNSPNTGFKKLCIHLDGVENTIIRVEFAPKAKSR
jgi:hypothetical protein